MPCLRGVKTPVFAQRLHAQWRMTGGVGDVLAGVDDRGDHPGEFVGMGCGDG